MTHFLNWMKNTLLFMHLQYKHSGPFANHKCEELSYAKNQKMCNPMIVTLLKKRPHYSQSSHKNVTPSSGTSPSAPYKEVPHPPTTPLHQLFENCFKKNNWCNWTGNYLSDWWKSTIANPGVHPFLGGRDRGHFLNSDW